MSLAVLFEESDIFIFELYCLLCQGTRGFVGVFTDSEEVVENNRAQVPNSSVEFCCAGVLSYGYKVFRYVGFDW